MVTCHQQFYVIPSPEVGFRVTRCLFGVANGRTGVDHHRESVAQVGHLGPPVSQLEDEGGMEGRSQTERQRETEGIRIAKVVPLTPLQC